MYIVCFFLQLINRLSIALPEAMPVLTRSQSIGNKFEAGHSNSCKIACAPSENTNQSAHPRSLVRVYAVFLKTFKILCYSKSVLRRGSDCVDAQADLSLLGAHAIL